VASRAYRLKLTPPSTTVAPRGELRPAVLAGAPGGEPRPMAFAIVMTTSIPSVGRAGAGTAPASVVAFVTPSFHSRGWVT
jgi:hypothetical protein